MVAGMERLKFMRGEWDVEAHIMSEVGEWIAIPLPKETTILPMLGGVCHREEMPVSYNGQTTRLFFSWSYDKYRKRYRMISCDDAEGLMSVLEGDFEEGTDTVIINNVTTRTAVLDTENQPAFFSQLASTKTSEDSFTDIVSESYDDGQNWSPVFRAIHTRKQ
jgi:hypothetical protein